MSIDPERKQRIQWWRDGKYGMFIHWGLYAIPAGVWKEKIYERGYSEWLMFEEKIPAAEYAELAAQFKPSDFDAAAWVELAKAAGMTYIVLTTKHHDGFSMFDSQVSDYSVTQATPWKRDPTRELADACRAAGIRFGCYYSTDRDWYRAQGPGNRYKQTNTWDYPESTHADFDQYLENIVKPQVAELLKTYQPDLLWFDEIDLKNDVQIQELHDLIREISPNCIINSRIKGCRFPEEIPPPNCDYISSGDNEILERDIDFEWENPGSMNTSYGYNRNDHNWVAPQDVVARLVDIVSKGGNYLLNVGPTADGVIPQPSADSLKSAGEWLAINGEAIYGSSAWDVATQDGGNGPLDVRYTKNGDAVYAICLARPSGAVTLSAFADLTVSDVRIVGSDAEVPWHQAHNGLQISLSADAPHPHALVCRIDLA